TDPYGTGKDVLMVAGADRDATRAAAERLISKL
ncbi:MAG: S-layer protein, partial [Theionarchaea archaeon]|nr:S-layer protein [Theionarchaea archaeon]